MLNVNQEKFCIEYAKCGNATEAYLKAGYKPKTEKATGASAARLLGNVRIQKRLAELAAEMAKPAIMSAEERQETLTEIVKQGLMKEDYNAACKAMDILNRMQGSYVNKVELGGPGGGPLEFSWAGGKE